MPPWKSLIPPDEVDIVSPEGQVRSHVLAYYSGSMFVIDDMSVDVRPGDEIRRHLPNGNEEAFRVEDPRFYDSSLGKHYQIKISRPMTYTPKTGGNYTVHVNGENSRVNIHSTDSSTNNVHATSVFEQARDLVSRAALAPEKADEVKAQINAMESARAQPTFVDAYQKFIGLTADHIGVFAPILTVFATTLAGLPHG